MVKIQPADDQVVGNTPVPIVGSDNSVPSTPTGQGKKEVGTVGEGFGETVDMKVADEIAKKENDEYWLSYGREVELEKELAEIGVENVESKEVQLPPDLAKQVGINTFVTAQTPIHEAIPGFSARGVVLNDDQLTSGKAQPVTKSVRWLVEWFIYELLKAHFLIKITKGIVARVTGATTAKA